ncbi:MAG: hypothetical protein QXS54_09025 [Candidatus Methanomethylicaceae archaeon]
MKTYAVYFKPCGALATWPLASDTLFGAVCWGIRLLGLMDDQRLTEWLENQLLTPRFAFSHALPAYYSGKTVIRCYPRPANFYPTLPEADALAKELEQEQKRPLKQVRIQVAKVIKEFKKVLYVSEAVLTRVLSGQLTPAKVLKSFAQEDRSFFLRGGVLGSSNEDAVLPQRLYLTEPVQHNHIDRVGGATAEGLLFYREETYFAPGAGLWAVLKAVESDVDQYIRPALYCLSDTGLGADRTTGKGHFEIWVESFEFPFRSAQEKAMIILSHYLPQPGEVDLHPENQAYILRTLRPRREKRFLRPLSPSQRSDPIYKQSIQVFAPGSVFALQQKKEIYGRLIRLTPEEDEPIYQSGASVVIVN